MERRFIHRAGAYGISGKFDWPVQGTIDVRPSVDLPPSGGFGRNVAESFNFQDLVSFRKAYTEVSGSPNEEPRNGGKVRAENNLSLTVIDDFDLLNVVSVDKIVSRITTRYFEGEDEIEVVLIGTRFEGFRIAGIEIKVKLATELYLEHPTFSKFTGALAQFERFRNGRSEGDNHALTLVESITVTEPTKEFFVHGNVIEIPHVGRLYLAELMVSKHHKSVNMIRWELGCPTGGSGNIGGGEGGGTLP